ncbi:MAG: hypothetical protein ACK5ML_11785 [Lachnospiraceae bacterium]
MDSNDKLIDAILDLTSCVKELTGRVDQLNNALCDYSKTKVHQNIDPQVVEFVNRTGFKNIINKPTSEIYKKYTLFCEEHDSEPIKNIIFSKVVNQMLDTKIAFKNIKGKTVRIFESQI